MLLFAKQGVLSVTVVTLVSLLYIYSFPVRFLKPSPAVFDTTRATRKVILSWTGFFRFPRFLTPDLEKLGCPSPACEITGDRSRLNASDAVLFHWFDVNLTDIPDLKKSRQRWVMLSFESPVHRPTGRSAAVRLGSRIDWTVSYRRDSDIPSPYGRFRPRSGRGGPFTGPGAARFSSLRPAAWMVSNCRTHGQRETVIRELRRQVRVDLYGKCGGRREMLRWDRNRAYKYLAGKYKFYLSFENAVCKDYVTEKVFYPLRHGMVPVVYGGAKYRDLLPPRSYVDVLDFESLDHLADHLKAAAANYTLYSQYQEWRKDFVVSKVQNSNDFFCDLCLKLHSDSGREVRWRPKSWFRSWWFNPRECLTLRRGHVLNFTLAESCRRQWYR